MSIVALTKMVDLDGGHLADRPLDKQIDVRDDDEGRRQRGTGVVLNNQVVALEFPVDVAVRLHHREGVAEWTQTELLWGLLSHGDRWIDSSLLVLLPEHGDEQVDEQDVGDQQVNDEQNHNQPVSVQRPAWLIPGLDQRHIVCAGIVPLLPNWNRYKDYTQSCKK